MGRAAGRLLSVQWLTVTLAVVVIYAGGAMAIVVFGDPIRQAVIGSQFLEQGRGASSAIDDLRGSEDSRLGYDGQFAAYVALDPLDAQPYLDTPAYRYSRILYPVVTRVAALGRAGAVPWMLILVNVISGIVLTLATAVVLQRRRCSAWYALLAGLAPGLAMGILYDLNEPLGYALAALGVLVIAGRTDIRRVAAAGTVFAFAGLARETTLLFPLAIGISLLLGLADTGAARRERHLRAGLLLLFLACAPAVVLRLVLRATVDGSIAPSGARPDWIPFHGLGTSTPGSGVSTQVLFVVVPAVLSVCAVWLTVRRPSPWLLALTFSVVLLVVLLPAGSYDGYLSSSRITSGIPLAFALCLPLVEAGRGRLAVALIPAIWWLPGWASVVSDFSLALSRH